MGRLLFLVEATPKPRRPEWKHGGPSRTVKGELAWSCGNTLCGECVALQRDQAGNRCEFTTQSGARCRFPLGHPDTPDAAPPNVPTHICIEPSPPPFTVEAERGP